MGINAITLSGNVANPELRTLADGKSVLKFRLATSLYQGKGKEDKTMWTDVTFWGNQATGIGNILKKGMPVVVQGTLSYNEWEDKQGNKRSSHSVVGSAIQLPPKRQEEEDEYEPEMAYADIPF